jgi:uncharacterized protein
MVALITTAKMNDVNPQAWLADALARIAEHPAHRLDDLLPWIGAPMPHLPRRLKQLERELLALGDDTMLIEELDGFIAGLLVCPDLIKPGEWLPIIWGRDGDDPQPAFDDLDHVNRLLGLIMEHYNGVARTDGGRRPLQTAAPVDERNGDILWELWIEGFKKAVKLRPAAWQRLLDSRAESAAATRGILTLVDLACSDQRGPRREKS